MPACWHGTWSNTIKKQQDAQKGVGYVWCLVEYEQCMLIFESKTVDLSPDSDPRVKAQKIEREPRGRKGERKRGKENRAREGLSLERLHESGYCRAPVRGADFAVV